LHTGTSRTRGTLEPPPSAVEASFAPEEIRQPRPVRSDSPMSSRHLALPGWLRRFGLRCLGRFSRFRALQAFLQSLHEIHHRRATRLWFAGNWLAFLLLLDQFFDILAVRSE